MRKWEWLAPHMLGNEQTIWSWTIGKEKGKRPALYRQAKGGSMERVQKLDPVVAVQLAATLGMPLAAWQGFEEDLETLIDKAFNITDVTDVN